MLVVTQSLRFFDETSSAPIRVASHAGVFRGARFSFIFISSLLAFVGRDEKRAPLKMPAWEATISV